MASLFGPVPGRTAHPGRIIATVSATAARDRNLRLPKVADSARTAFIEPAEQDGVSVASLPAPVLKSALSDAMFSRRLTDSGPRNWPGRFPTSTDPKIGRAHV